MTKPKVFVALTTCHPERPYYAKGLCKECYFLAYRKTHQYQEYLKSGRLNIVQKRYRNTPHGAAKIKRYKSTQSVRDRSATYYRKKQYGLSDQRYDELLLNQDGRCAICYADDCQLHIDHCHDSGSIRGLLCRHCNNGLGHFRDSKLNLNNAVKYLSL